MRLRNSLTGQYKTLSDENIKVYVCGPTVYNYCHIGHGRAFIVFDLLYRVLSIKFKKVTIVQNITDIGEPIFNKAKEEGIKVQQIVDKYTDAFMKDVKTLNVSPFFTYVKASNFIPQIIDYIQVLLNNGHAYIKEKDGVYFKTSNFNYDLFENRSEESDFALWKNRDNGIESPWGMGIPGWHIECSVMCKHTLGDVIHIHCGGCDLKFPHHQNEIVQHWGFINDVTLNKNTDIPVKIWMHNNMLNINDTKMSKSLGNTLRIRDFVNDEYDADVFRYMMLKTHYSKILYFDDSMWIQSQQQMNHLRKFYFKNQHINTQCDIGVLQDDLDSAAFLNEIFRLINQDNQAAMNMLMVIGFYMKPRTSLSIEEINELVLKRDEHRKNKNYIESDKIRQYLLQNYVAVDDNESTIWYFI